ncbi:hypothetical protein [Maritimibacter sp. HL-12]|jgi:hypothetical protein|uniref:hypothetical protein n=1 Tax=Maritimibacter sp. HL-12 TaxID=1162418 RepID=UPI000A0F3A73|nr:hypothetical protein [Maritimibacter sp. HL-12]SMH36089.1 hypothetical protein SAMN05661107_0689 [Maritimibacter sp. HL-12]
MTDKPRSPASAGKAAVQADKNHRAPKPDRAPAHHHGQPAKGGFDKKVKPIPLTGKHRGR